MLVQTSQTSQEAPNYFNIIMSRNFREDGVLLESYQLPIHVAAVDRFYRKDDWTYSRISGELIAACANDDCFHAVSQLVYDRRLIHDRSLPHVCSLMHWNEDYMKTYLIDHPLRCHDVLWALIYLPMHLHKYMRFRQSP
jgi:hypothetical protein